MGNAAIIRRKLLIACFLLTAVVRSFAGTGVLFSKDGFTYSRQKYTSCDNCLSVTSYQADSLTDYSQPLHVPSKVIHEGKTYYVKEIGQNAFAGVTDIQSVVIEEGIEGISNRAFECCVNLKSVYIPASVDCLGREFFGSCYSLTSVVVDSNNETFDSRDNSNAIIDTEEDELVVACSSTTIPSSVKSIGESAFYHCNTMEHLVIPEGVEKIDNVAFYGCSNLKSVSLPESLKEIGGNVFDGCCSLTSIFIPKNVAKIYGDNLFAGCYALTSIQVDSANPYYDSRSGCNGIVRKSDSALVSACGATTISDDIRVLESCCFYGTIVHSVYIPKSVENVSGSAFTGCWEIDEITVAPDHPNVVSPKGSNAILTRDGKALLLGCRTTVIPDGVETIGEYAFWGRYIKLVLRLPETIKRIEDSAFSNCNGINGVIIPRTVESIGFDAFSDCRNLREVQILSPIKKIPCKMFFGCYNLSVISLHEGVEEIDERAFDGCRSLKHISLPKSVTKVVKSYSDNICPAFEKK